MKLESQVCNLALATGLKALGVKQESLFQWSDLAEVPIVVRFHENREKPDHYWCAFTVAELGEMLPKGFVSMPTYSGRPWLCANTTKKSDLYNAIYAETEADARAWLLVDILQKKNVNL